MSRGGDTPLWMRLPSKDVPGPRQVPPRARRHCWVAAVSGEDCEGLLLTWTRQASGWEGLVVYVDAGGRAITEQVPAERIRPAS